MENLNKNLIRGLGGAFVLGLSDVSALEEKTKIKEEKMENLNKNLIRGLGGSILGAKEENLNKNLIKKVLKEKNVEDMVELIQNLDIDRDWNLKRIELLEERVLELANKKPQIVVNVGER